MQPMAEVRSRGLPLRPPQGLAGAAFWLAVGFVLLWLLNLLPWVKSTLLSWKELLARVLLLTVCIRLGVRYVRRRLLWSLRSKLILTYLLIGLAPVVLFVTLVGFRRQILARSPAPATPDLDTAVQIGQNVP